ncbi:MAG: tRNA (5-methylaminomethyl-2-thiouridine)(34)-methyltransferase MnmD [Bacteroidales bacterium]
MERRLIKTGDGSHTIFIPELGEHYHSIHGSVTESEHIYINAAFNYSIKDPVRVLEYGMGTGLNVLLTWMHANRTSRSVYYHAIEKYPVTTAEKEMLNLSGLTQCSDPAIFDKIHDAEWDSASALSEKFELFKQRSDFRDPVIERTFDVIYYDAFAPEVQPALWTAELFRKIFNLAASGAVLTTYSAKGQVRRNLQSAGFTIQKLPGPPGKREFTRATK